MNLLDVPLETFLAQETGGEILILQPIISSEQEITLHVCADEIQDDRVRIRMPKRVRAKKVMQLLRRYFNSIGWESLIEYDRDYGYIYGETFPDDDKMLAVWAEYEKHLNNGLPVLKVSLTPFFPP